MRIRLFFLVTFLAVILAACTAPTLPVILTPAAATQIPSAQQVAPQATEAAQQALAKFLGINIETIKLEKIEDEDWSDGCLGIPAPDRGCLAVITPGYRFTFTVNDQSYEVRTNLDGSVVGVANTLFNVDNGSQQAVVDLVRQELATRLGIALDQVQVSSVEAMDWPDGCLGLAKPDEICTMAIVPGYHITLLANGVEYAFRTDQSGAQIREEAVLMPGAEQGVLIAWNRSGGIAGFCDQLLVYQDFALASSCKASNEETRVRLTPEQMSDLQEWSQRFASFDVKQKDPAVADAMSVSLSFTGSGQQDPSNADQAAILEFAQQIYTSASE